MLPDLMYLGMEFQVDVPLCKADDSYSRRAPVTTYGKFSSLSHKSRGPSRMYVQDIYHAIRRRPCSFSVFGERKRFQYCHVIHHAIGLVGQFQSQTSSSPELDTLIIDLQGGAPGLEQSSCIAKRTLKRTVKVAFWSCQFIHAPSETRPFSQHKFRIGSLCKCSLRR